MSSTTLYSIHRFKLVQHNKRYHGKLLLNSFHLNGHTLIRIKVKFTICTKNKLLVVFRGCQGRKAKRRNVTHGFSCYIYYQSVVIRSILLNWWRFLTLRFYYFLPFESILMLYLLYLVLTYLHDFVMRIIIIIPDIIGISWKHSSNLLGMYLYD